MTVAVEREQRPRSGGWMIIARKEFADHLLSVRFVVLLVVLGLVAAASVYTAAQGIRDVASDATETPSLFLRLFTINIEPVPFPFFLFVAFLAPLLGIAFGFDAVNGERARGTLPRLVSQPIYRDDVINGKFAAGLAVIAVIMTAVTLVVAGIGIVRLGIVPSAGEVGRLVVWLAATIVYIGIWLAFAMLCSVWLRRAATSALVAIAVWLVLALFGALIAQVVAGVVAPSGPSGEEVFRNLQVEQTIARVSPVKLYDEATTALLNPAVRSVSIVTLEQLDRAVLSDLSLIQSLLLVWPQLVGMVSATVVLFALSYVSFMRQEIRA
jgi:ABC-2 type transport system permease protein